MEDLFGKVDKKRALAHDRLWDGMGWDDVRAKGRKAERKCEKHGPRQVF